MPDFKLREATATPQDLKRLVEFVNAAYRGPSSKSGRAWTTEADLLDGQRVDQASLAELMRADTSNAAASTSTILMLEHGTDLWGCVNLRRLPNNLAYLGMLTVAPKHQNSGAGRELLSRAEAWARQHWQVRGIEMTVIQLRHELISWYQRRGYSLTDETRPFPYNNPRFGLPRRDDLHFVVLTKVWE
ncbi:MAG TPA: GNAT family N-acetyltransferase [Pseudobdellovibrionaceae bacterium]|nr:GNAT family N-acetyltransferase [Pseudobdellovibrionaceae bacterium]